MVCLGKKSRRQKERVSIKRRGTVQVSTVFKVTNAIKMKGQTHHPHNQIPHSPHKLENRNPRHTPQNHSHINLRPRILRTLIIRTKLLHARRIKHNCSKRKVAKHPHQYDGTPETLVVVCLALFFRDCFFLLWWFDGEFGEFRFVLRVEVAIVLRDVDIDFAAGFEVCRGKLFGFVVAFCAPGYVVGVAECVDVEDVDVGGGEEDVLDELGC